MNLQTSLTPLISLVAGILILGMPRMLNFIVAIHLIVIGVVGLVGGRWQCGRQKASAALQHRGSSPAASSGRPADKQGSAVGCGKGIGHEGRGASGAEPIDVDPQHAGARRPGMRACLRMWRWSPCGRVCPTL